MFILFIIAIIVITIYIVIVGIIIFGVESFYHVLLLLQTCLMQSHWIWGMVSQLPSTDIQMFEGQ